VNPRPLFPLLATLTGISTILAVAPPQAAQQKELLASFPVTFYGKGANSLDLNDPLVATMTDSILRSDLEQAGRFQVIDTARRGGVRHPRMPAAGE
jgi:hypothetical protein